MVSKFSIRRASGRLLLLICAAALPTLLTAQSPESPVEAINFDIKRAELERQEFMRQAETSTREGNKAFETREYQQAIDSFLKAIASLEKCGLNRQDIQDKIKSCKQKIARSYEFWSRSLYMEAMDKLKINNIDEAIALCDKASEVYPPSKKRNDELIEKYRKDRKGLAFRSATNEENVIPDLEQRKYNLEILLRQGKAYFNAGEFELARGKYEEVLIADPYNNEAIDKLYKLNLRLLDIAGKRADATHNERMAETQWKGVSPVLPKSFAGALNQPSTIVKKGDMEDAIHKKLKDIIIDHIEFEEVSIPTVIKYLKMRSKQIDPEKVGVNMFLRITPSATAAKPQAAAPAPGQKAPGGANAFGAAPAAADNPFGGDDAFGGGNANKDSEPSNMPTVTMVLDNISLGDAIRYICRAVNLKYRVEKYAVVIASQDVALDDVETRIYPIEHEAIDSIGGGDPEAVKKHFESRGVSFPAGAKIVYDSRISRLIATNTPENLKKIEAIIHSELNAVDPQVLIQAKFVEINQNDLDELGFSYTLSRNLSGTSPITGQPYSMTNNGRIEFSKNDKVTRSAGGIEGVGGDTAFSITHFANGWEFNATVNALDRCDSADILSSPRITTMNGQEATIRMVREVYYPSDWSEPRTATVNGTTTTGGTSSSTSTISSYVSSIPEFDDPTEEGIILTVTPNVDADRYTITMVMKPTIQRFTGWTDYSYQMTIPDTNQQSGVRQITNILKQPVIAARTVDTTVSIYDGETIVLGGIISDQVESVDDNVPILGKIPFIGRAFQSKYQKKTKRNLLIFLTCRLVNPDGSPLRERKQRGLPPFRR